MEVMEHLEEWNDEEFTELDVNCWGFQFGFLYLARQEPLSESLCILNLCSSCPPLVAIVIYETLRELDYVYFEDHRNQVEY